MKKATIPTVLLFCCVCLQQLHAAETSPNTWVFSDSLILNCPPPTQIIGDTTPNNINFWNYNYYWDATLNSHDLCEGPADLSITATGTCLGAATQIQYLLFLDLDSDDSTETVLNSANLGSAGLGWNNILFGNAVNPNYSGGIPRKFDVRQIANNQKYGFALQITQTGQTRTASVRWNTQADSNTYFLPQLPYGKHKIVWIIRDTCGNEQTCTSHFTIKDTGLPSIQCLPGLSVNIFPNGKIQLWASDFLMSIADNCTPHDNLMIATRKSGTGTGFPLEAGGNPQTNVVFTCGELGVKNVELWVKDKAGNANSCISSVTVNDNYFNCGDPTILRGQAATEADKGVENVAVHMEGSGYNLPLYSQFFKTNVLGFYNAYGVGGMQVIVTPYKNDNPLNGISTYDLVLLSKHILGVEALNSPYKIIAADVNKSNSITSFDIVELRKLILGIDTAFHNNTSWRFVEKKYVFPNPINPFEATFNEQITLPNYSGWENFQDFVAIKIGDLNGNAITSGSASASEARSTHTLMLSAENRAIKAGETFTLHLTAAERVQAYQFTLNFQNLTLLNVQPLSKDMYLGNFGVFEHALTTSYNGEEAGKFDLTFRALADGNIRDFLYLSDEITPSAAYLQDQRMDIDLQFKPQNTADIDFEVFQNQPNPMETSTRIGVKTAREMSIKLGVFDLTGHLLHTQQGQFEKGYHAFTLNRSDLPENATGILLYKIETDFGSLTRKMMLLR